MADEDDVSVFDGVGISAPVLEPAAPVLEPTAPDLLAPVADTAPDTAPVITGGWAPVTERDRGDHTADTAVNEGETSSIPDTMPVVPDLMIGSAFGMKVPPPEYSGIPQVTEDRDPELAEVLKKKKEFGQGDEMSDIRESVVGDDLASPLLEPAPTKKSKKKKKRSQKDDMDIMPSIAAPAAITVNPPSRITGPIELDEEDYKKDDSEPLKFPKFPGARPGDDEVPRDRDRARSSERRGGRRGDRDRRDDRRGRNDDEDEYGRSGRNWSQRPRHGKYKYPDDFDEEDFEDFGEEDYGNDYDEYGPPHGRHGRDYGPGPGHYGPGPDFHGPHGPGYGPRHFGPDGYGGYGPPPLLGPPNMGPMGPGPPMGPGGPMGPGYPGYGPPGYMDGYQGPPGPGYPMPPQGPWQGDGGFPPQPNYPMPPQPPAGFSGEVFQGFPNIPVPAMPPTDAAPPIVQPSESAEKLIAMGMNPDLAKILDADSKNKPRLDSDPSTPSKSKKKKKKKDKAGPELPADMMQLPMSIPLPDDVPLPPEPKKKKSKKREKDLENVMFPPLPEALTMVVGPAPKPATPPVPPTDGTTETFTGVQPPVQPAIDISHTKEVSSMPGINVNPLQYSASVPQPVQAPQPIQASQLVQDPQVYVPPPAVVENISLSQPIAQVSAGPEQVPQVVPQPVQPVKPSGRRSRFDPNWTPEQKQAPVAVPPPVPEVMTQVPPPQIVSDVVMSVPPVPEPAPQPPVPEVTPQPPVPVEPLPVQPVPAPIPQQHIPLQPTYMVPPVTKPGGQNFAETATHTQKIEDFSPMDISMEQSPPRGEGKPDDKPAEPGVDEDYVYFENKVYGKDDPSNDSQASKEPVTASQLLEKFKQKRQQQNTDPKSDFTIGNVEQKTPVDKSQGKFTFAIRKLKQLEAEKEEEEKQVLEALAAGDDQKQSAKDGKDNKGKDKVSVEEGVTGSKDKKDRSTSRSRDRRSRSRSGSRSKHRRYRSDSRDRSNSRERYKSRDRSKSRSKSRDRKRRSRSKKRDRSLSPWRKDREFFRRYGRFPRPGEADTITRETASSSKERGSGRYDNRFDNNRSRGSRGGNRYGDYGRNWDHGRSWGRDRSRDDDRDRERSRDDRDSRDRKRDKGRYSKYSDEEEYSKKSKDKKKRRGHSSSSERDSSSHSESSDDGKRKKKKNKKKSIDRSSSGERSQEKSKDRSESADKKGRKSRDRKDTDEGIAAVVKQEPVDDDNMTGEDKLAEKSNDEMTSSIKQEQMVSTFVPVVTGDSIYTAEEMDTDSPEKNPETSEKNQTDYDEGEIVDERENDHDASEITNRSSDRTNRSRERKDRSRERTDHSRERTDHSRDKKAERERREYSRERSESFSKQKDKARASSEEVEEKRSHKSRDKSDKYGSKYSKEDSYEEEEDRHRSSREDKYSRHREDKHKRRDRNDDQGEREKSRKYRDYDDDDSSYKRRGRDDDRQRRHDDRYGRSEGAEETVHTKSKWDSGSESETERTHIEELPVRGSSSIPEPCIEDLQPVPGKSGVVKLEIDISKINQKLLSKMMKSKNTTKSGSEQTSDSSDDNESKYKRKQKKDKEKETKKSKKGKKKEESESESEDSPVKTRKKKKTKKKKKHYDEEESDDNEVVSKKKKKEKYATSDSEASSGEEVRGKKKYADKSKSRKHDSDSEGSTSKYRKDKQKKTKKVKKYESSDEEYVVKKHKKSRYEEDSEDNGRKKNESAKKKKGKDKSKSYDDSDAESPDRKSKHKSKHSRDRSESIGDRDKGRSKKSKDKYDDNENKKSRKKNKGRDESDNSDSQAESKPKRMKDRNASESDDGSQKKHSSKYDIDESDGYTAKPKNSKQHKESDHEDSENERSRKKRRKKDEDRKSKSIEREDKSEKKYKDERDHVDDSDNEDRSSRKKSSRHSSEKSAKDSRHYSKERLMAEEKRSESREKRYNESARSDKVKKRSRSRSPDERSYKVLKSDKKKHRHSSESESNSDRDVKQKSRRRGSSSEDGRKGKSSKKYEDERPKKSERSRREEKSGRDRHSDSSPDVETKHKYKKDESGDEDYRSRKKREVDKKGRKKKYSSSVSENSSSSSSDTGSDSDRDQRRTKSTGQKNVLAATGLEMGPVAGTPLMKENRDDEMSERNVLPDDYNEKYPILSENEELEAQLVKDKLDTSTEKTEKNSKKKDKKKNKKKKKKKKSELKNRKSKESELNKSTELDNAEQHSDKQDDVVDSISNNDVKSKKLPVVEYGSSSSEMETNDVSAKLEKRRGSVESENSKGRINFRLSSTDEKTDIKLNKGKHDVGRKESKRMSISPEFRRNDKQRSFSPENKKKNKQRSFSPENKKKNKQRSFSPENKKKEKQRSFSPENKKKDKQRSTSPEIKATEKRRSSSPKEIKNKLEDKQLTENSDELYDPFEAMEEDSDEMELEKHESSKQSVDIKANDELKPATQTTLTLSSRTILPDITQGVIPSSTVYPIKLSVGPVAPPSGVLAPLIVPPLSTIVPNQPPSNIIPVQQAGPRVSLDAIRQPVVPVLTAPVPAVQPVPEPISVSSRSDPGKLTSSKQKAVVQVYIPSGDKGEKKSKSKSRWGASEDASKPKQEVDSAELYDPFSDMLTYSPNPESEPNAAEPVKIYTETVQLAPKPIKDNSPAPVLLPADTEKSETKSEGQKSEGQKSESQKSDNQNKITMKFVTGRKLIGKSAIEMEESEEKLESAPKMKLSTPYLTGLESPPKMKSTPGLSAIQISQQVAASIEKTLDADSDRRHERRKEIKDRSRDRSRERTDGDRSRERTDIVSSRERSDRVSSRERSDRDRSRERSDRDRSRERTDRDRSRESPPGNARSRSPERVYSFTDHRRRSLSPTRRERKRSPGRTDRSSYDRKHPHRRSESRERRSKSRDRDRHRDNKGHPGDRRHRGNRDNRGDKDSAGRSDRKQSPVDSRRRNRRKRRSRSESPQTKKSQRHKTDKQRNASNSDDTDDSSESSPGSSSDSESGDKGAVAKSKTIETDYKMDYGRKSDTLRSDSVDGTTVVTEMLSAPTVEHADIFLEDIKEKHDDSVKLEVYSPHDSPVDLFDIPSSDLPLPSTDSLKTSITVNQSGFIDADDNKAAKNRSCSVETDEPIGRLTRKQAAVENVVLPPVMLVRSGRRRSSAETTNTELQHEGKRVQDVKLTGENIDTSNNPTVTPDDAYDPEDETVIDTPVTGSNEMDENYNTVSAKASNEDEETPEQCMDIVDMDLDDSDDTDQNIELGNTDKHTDQNIELGNTDKHTDKLVEKAETNTTLPKISIETLSPSEMPGKQLGSESAASSVKGFSLKLGTSVFKKQKPTLTTSALQSVFDTDDSKPDRPKINFKPISEHIKPKSELLKPKSEPLKPLTFGSIELKPPAVELTAAVASFKPLSEGSSAQPDVSIKQPDKADTKAEERRADAGQRADNPAVPSSVDTEAIDTTVAVQNVREPIHTPTAVSTVRADNMVRIPQISPEQIGKAIQVIGQENLRRLEVMKREVAQRDSGTIEGQKIEVVGSATQFTTQLTTPLNASTSSLQGTSSLAPISNLDIKKEYEDPDLNQLEREKQELLDKLDVQDDATPTYDDNYSPRYRSPTRRDSPGRHDSPRHRNSPPRRDSPGRRASPARRDSRTDSRDSTRYDSYRGEDERYGGRVDRRGEDYDDRKSSRYRDNRDRRHSRDRSPERSRDRGRYRGRDGRDRDRGRTPDRSRDRSRERRNRKRSYKDEDRFRQRRRSRSRSRDRRSYSRDRRSRSRERRERRSSSRGRDKKRSRSRDRRSWSRDKRSWSKDRRRGRHSRSRSREKRSRSRDKPDTHRKESALEKFEKELAEKKKTLLQPVSTSGSPSLVSQPGPLSTGPPRATSVDGSLAYTDPALAPYGPIDSANSAPPAHFLPQPFPVHHNMPPMFPMGAPMSDQGMGPYPPDPNLYPPHHMGQPFYGDSMQPPPPQMGPIPPDGMQPPHMMPPGGPMGPPFTGPPGFMPGMFPPGPPGPPHPMDPNFQLPSPASIPPDQPAMSGPGQSGSTLTGTTVHPTPPRSVSGQLKDNAQKIDSERSEPTSEPAVDSPNLQKGVAGPGMPGHLFVKPPRKERVSRWSKEPAIKLETLTSLADIDTNFEFKPAKPKREETKSGESGESSGDTTGFGLWQPVVDKVKDESPVERSESYTGQRAEGRDEFSISSKYEEGYSDIGLDSTPQSQSEDTSDTDSTTGKLMKVKSRWRRASEAEAPPPPPPPSKTLAQQAEVQEKTDEKQDEDEEIKIDFELIDENIHLNESRKRSKQMREVRRMVCDCTTSREDREMGYEACGEDCLNKMLFIECGSKCPCGEYCNNKRFQKKQNAKVAPFRTEWKGCGLKALEDLEVGQFVMEYVGEVLDYPLFKKRSKQYSKAGQQHFYFMAINPEEIVDATIKGNISRFINHSCDPNCETQKWTVNGSLRVGFFVRKPIKKDEEITFDYKYEVYGKEAQKCYCGTEACRGWLGGDKRMELKSSRRSTSVDEVEKKKKELFDDSDKLEEEIERMCELEQGLRNKTDVLNMCRLMVRVEDPKHRLQILKVLENTTEPACLRLFLDYHGLPLVWCWMADVKQSESADLKHSTLNVLKQLPITNKTVLQNSKILDIVTKWSDAGDTLLEPVSDVLETSQEVTDTDNTENDDELMPTPPVSHKNPVSILASPLDKKAVKKSVKFAEVESSSDSESRASASEADTGDTVDMDVTSSSQTGARTRKQKLELRRKVLEKESGDSDREPVEGDTDSVSDGIQSADADSSSEKQSESNQNEADSENNDLKMSDMESDDKSETLDLCEGRTLELSEDTDMSDVTAGEMSDVTAGESEDVGISQKDAEELETIVKNAEIRNLASELLQQWSTLKELYKIPKKQVLEERKRTERELDTHYEKFARIEERKKKVSGWDVKGRKRKRESSYNKDRDEDSDSRRALLSTPPRMSKLERRQLFEAQVKAQDERDAELQRQQEQMMIEEQMMQQQHQRQLMQDPGFWYYATQDPTFLPSIGIDPQQFLQQLAVDPVLLQQLMATIPNFQQQLEHLTYMYQQAVLQASQLDMVMPQPEPPVVMEDNEPMTEQHMAFLQQVEAFKQQHLEPAAPQLDPTGDEDVPPPPSPPRGKAVVLPPNWKTARDAEGKMYYYHTVTRQTQWDPPNLDTGDHNIDDMDLGTPTFDDTNNKPETKEEKTTTAAADTSSEMSRKLKEHFKTKMSSWIVVCLNPFRKPDCKLGKISSTEDFKHLARKLTHHVMAKELKHCRHVEDLEVNENVKYKAKDFVKKYMTKFGHHYKRSGNSPNYD